MDAALDLSPGALVGGRYRLTDALAQGGTASVWRAVDERLERQVALKVLKDEGVDPQLRQRAEREAVVLASLAHPNIVRVLDSGVDEGRPFLVMELLEGTTLHQILAERGHLEVDEAVRMVADVAEGLGVAHAAGVIHRDVKPANVMCDGDVPTLVDFGIARRSDATTMTSGLVLGTASYLAPEQAQGLPLTPAADVYALGCLLVELLTGAPPFRGDGPMDIAHKHVHEPPAPPSERDPAIPAAVDAVVLRSLSKDPNLRPVDGAALAAELRGAIVADAEATVAVPLLASAPTMAMPAPVAAPPAVAAPPLAAAALDGARWRIVAALAIAAVVLVIALRMLDGGDATTVPDLIGATVDDARAELLDVGLEAVVTEVDDAAARGTVLSTDPGPGEEVDGDTVAVAVSNGSGAAPAATPTTAAPPPPSEDDGEDDDDDGEGRGRGNGNGRSKKDGDD